MLSKIKFDLSEDNSPVIVAEVISSEDVRDKIAKRFIEGFMNKSNECNIEFTPQNSNKVNLTISPKILSKKLESDETETNELLDRIKFLENVIHEMETTKTKVTISLCEDVKDRKIKALVLEDGIGGKRITTLKGSGNWETLLSFNCQISLGDLVSCNKLKRP